CPSAPIGLYILTSPQEESVAVVTNPFSKRACSTKRKGPSCWHGGQRHLEGGRMSLKDWEETGGKPQASPDAPPGAAAPTSAPSAVGPSPRFYRLRSYDPLVRRRLLELMAAMIIIFCVMYMMIPVFIGTAESSRRSVCASHLHRLVQAARMYEMDAEGMPPTAMWTRALYRYVLDPGQFGRSK